ERFLLRYYGMTMQAAQVRLENISKRFGEFWAVRRVNLQIQQGEFYTLLGPSGCGKSTLLRTIAGFVTPDEGTVYLEGAPVNHIPPWERNVGMVFQNYALWPHMTVFENVAFGLRERKIGRDEIERKVRQTLEQVGLTGTEERRPSQLSGGQQQRVALARTLVVQPQLLLLDEPLSNLDAKLRAEMRLELLKLQRDLGITTLYVTHDQEEALALSTRIAVMESGRVVQEGEPREIYEQPREKFVADFVGKSNLFSGTVVRAGDGMIEVETEEGLRIRAASPTPTPAGGAGKEILLNIRPEAIELIAAGETSTRTNRISGKVAASAYQGSFVEYEIEAQGRPIKANVINPKEKRLFRRGEEVSLIFDPEDVGVIRRQP
ncbi:MAG: ABC transporter ATP-binding protein, partial [Candidatus Binatota bacterium]